jgi:hypothetical protein
MSWRTATSSFSTSMNSTMPRFAIVARENDALLGLARDVAGQRVLQEVVGDDHL